MLNYGSTLANGQLIPTRTVDAYSPRPWGPVMMTAPSSVNTVPPQMAQGGGVIGGSMHRTAGVQGGVDGGLGQAGVAKPFDWALSPIPIIILCLVVAIMWLRGVHWGGG